MERKGHCLALFAIVQVSDLPEASADEPHSLQHTINAQSANLST